LAVQEDKLIGVERDVLRDRFADFERAVLQDNIALCDTKAGLLLAFTGAMVIFCIDAFVTVHAAPGAYQRFVGPAMRGLFVIATIGFLASAQFSLTTVLPRMVRGAGDHVFWESPVFKLPVERYVAEMEILDPAVERHDKLRHLHLQAGICRRKFGHFATAMRLAQLAFVALVIGEVLRVAG
jgi:hypothetical protein